MPNVVRHLWAAVGLVALVAPGTEAHKAITSPYNYNDHVFPILRDRCSRCHFPDGPAPMSLLTYNDTLPWAEGRFHRTLVRLAGNQTVDVLSAVVNRIMARHVARFIAERGGEPATHAGRIDRSGKGVKNQPEPRESVAVAQLVEH